MKKSQFILLVLLLMLCSNVNGQVNVPTIRCQDGKYVLSLPEEMEDAIHEFNPRFETWKTEDYVNGIFGCEKKDGTQKKALFALIVDANRDGKMDVILDGHDDKSCLLICVLSDTEGYYVELADSSELVVPREIINYHEGKKYPGLPYYIIDRCVWSYDIEHFNPHHTFVFQKVIPQQDDSNGNLLFPEGGTISFFFEDGEFRKDDFDPF